MTRVEDGDRDSGQPAGLSLTQILAGALAAVTTTVALSYLGVLGTITGAALASILSVVGNHYYSRSIEHTRSGVRVVRARLPARTSSDDDRTSRMPVLEEPAGAPLEEPAGPPTGTARVSTQRGRDRRALLLSVAGVFLVILSGVTVVELAMGRPLSKLLRNEQGSGTSVFGNSSTPAPATTPTSTPTTAPTATQPTTTQPTTTSVTTSEPVLPTTPPATATTVVPTETTTATEPTTTAVPTP
ncbi:MAG TPA: hypothetical protein VFJ97_04375 [Dermatophilaceae bacterium]|nr:hypothetical protein [Dermatophilaceae bacterium]